MSVLVLSLAVIFLFIDRAAAESAKSRILYVDSYNPEYPWSAGIETGIETMLKGHDDVILKVIHMDTKRHTSEEFKKKAALKAKKVIETWQPDVVIASDDNASKYLVAPYFKNADLPFVFCGVNWDASIYGYPFSNVTGMVEVLLTRQMVDQLRALARGDRIGFLAAETFSTHKILTYNRKIMSIAAEDVRFVKTQAEWQSAYLQLQKNCDLLLLTPWYGISDWNKAEMKKFVLNNITVPTGTSYSFMADYSLVCYATDPEEQGEWAADTALEILAGKLPTEIPVATNKRARIILNMPLAKALGITFPLDLVSNAELISARKPRVLFVNSYHRGYAWSDGVEKGLLKALKVNQRPDGSLDCGAGRVELKIVRMNTKLNRSEEFKQQAAKKVKQLIDTWQPDIVVVSDDNACKYLLLPYYKDKTLPFVFCGLNWGETIYGLPYSNTTGMIEVEPVKETYALLRRFARGERLGFIGSNTLTGHKFVHYYEKILGRKFTAGKLVDTFAQWRDEYLKLQKDVDMIYVLPPYGISDWDKHKALALIFAHSRIPSAASSELCAPYVLFGKMGIAEEQGWWSGRTVLKILDGRKPNSIPVTTNHKSRLYLNMKLAKTMGIVFPVSLIEQAVFVDEE